MAEGPFVLVHGAWHNGSHWDKGYDEAGNQVDGVKPELATVSGVAADKIFTPTMPGHGDPAAPGFEPCASLASAAQFLADYVVNTVGEPTILVGHSLGGYHISGAAQILANRKDDTGAALPNLVKRVVYLNAVVPSADLALVEEVPPTLRRGWEGLIRPNSQFFPELPAPPFPAKSLLFRETLGSPDATAASAAAAFDTLHPCPFGMFSQRLDVNQFYRDLVEGKYTASYVHCLDDAAVPHGPYDWPKFATRLGVAAFGYRKVSVPQTGHEALLFSAKETAKAIWLAGRE